MITLKILINDEDLTERQEEYHYLVAKRKLSRTFKGKLRETIWSDFSHDDFEISAWHDYEAELLEFSKTMPCVRFFLTEQKYKTIDNGLVDSFDHYKDRLDE